ncbi:MAG: OmpH family outer membrane protein [Phycisphaeraceae bacterium]|nr:OmpH family outer membrane protein [Phycisphaeraceae bacterium]
MHTLSALRSHRGVVITALLVLGALLAFRSVNSPTTVAVVDLEAIYDNLNEHKDAEARLSAMVDELASELQKREQEVKMVQLELQAFSPQGQGFVETQAKVEAAIGRFRAYQEFAKIKTERESERLLKETYDRVKLACAAIAREQGIQLVLLDDATPQFAPTDPRPMMQQISARRSLFVDPSIDITKAVIERMNRDFAARSGGSATP